MSIQKAEIDFVITWVDSSDPAWLERKRAYTDTDSGTDSKNHRYRDWGLLRYWFRMVEKNAPWVRKVHLVTCGQIPDWIDVDNPKLHLVNHSDYIPEEYLPTFSSHPIELNMHHIEGLSEQFVYFNDDTFVNAPTSPEDYFVNGMPVDLAALNVHCYTLESTTQLYAVRAAGIVNKYFDMHDILKREYRKWFNVKAGRYLARTLVLAGCPRFPGFFIHHCGQPFLRSTFERLWSLEPEILHDTCTHKFRDVLDVNPWLMKDWQIASGQFVPNSAGRYAYFYINSEAVADNAAAVIEARKVPHLCLNDSMYLQDVEYRSAVDKVRTALNKIYGDPCSFEHEQVTMGENDEA